MQSCFGCSEDRIVVVSQLKSSVIMCVFSFARRTHAKDNQQAKLTWETVGGLEWKVVIEAQSSHVAFYESRK